MLQIAADGDYPSMPRSSRLLARRVVAISFVAAAIVPALTVPAGAASGFTSGDLVVYRVGTGTAIASGTSAPVTLDEYVPTTPNQSAPAFSLALLRVSLFVAAIYARSARLSLQSTARTAKCTSALRTAVTVMCTKPKR